MNRALLDLWGMRGVGPTHVEADRHVVGKNSIDAAAKCVTKALDYNFGSPRPRFRVSRTELK
jgi:hypothetical protein